MTGARIPKRPTRKRRLVAVPTSRSRWRQARRDFRAWVINHAPIPLLTHAHEVGISVALAVVALPLLGGADGPPSIHQQVYHWVAVGWAWALLASGFLTIVGLFTNRPRLEWAGQLFTGHSLTFYAFALVLGAGRDGILASSIFGILGLVSYWRSFKITHAPLVQARLLSAARSAHELVHAGRKASEARGSVR